MLEAENSAFICPCSEHPEYRKRNEFVSDALVEAVSVYCGLNGRCPKAAMVVLAKITAKMMLNIDKSERLSCEKHFMLLLESEFAEAQ